MTDSEIIKSLERCLSKRSEHNCVSCSFYETDFCYNALFIVVLNLINRQKAEIERLKKIEANILDVMRENIEQTQAEAIKEFAERLKTKLKDEIWDWVGDMEYEPNRAYGVGRVWSIINEMVGDE